MITLVAGMCIMLEGFAWKIETKYADTYNLSYYVKVRTDMNNKIEEVYETRSSLWKAEYVNKNAKKTNCERLGHGTTKRR